MLKKAIFARTFESMAQKPIVAILFGILLLLMMPAMISNLPFTIQQSAFAQDATTMTEASSSPTINNNQNNITNITTTESEITEETGLPRQEGFSVRVLATNISAPHNILYGPHGALWITERVGENIIRVDPSNGWILSSVEVLHVHQSGGQDALMGMAFDPDFNNTRYIYAAYTYSEIAGQEVAGQDPVELFRSENRYRDVEFSPDGRSIYVITDSSGPVQAIVDEIYFLS